jgi:hypothetical protein
MLRQVLDVDVARQLATWQHFPRPKAVAERSLAVVEGSYSNAVSGERDMQVTFTDPMTSDCLVANVSPAKTASGCIEALKSKQLLPAGDYHLAVNGRTLLPNQTLGEAGVRDGATVAIHRTEQGA